MALEDVQALRRFYELVRASMNELNANAAARADISAALEGLELPRTAAVMDACDPEVEWLPEEAEGGVFQGRRGIVSMLQGWYEAMEDWWVEPEEIVDAGDVLLMALRTKARGRASGVPTDDYGYAVFRLRDGKVLRCEEFSDLHTAQQAAGLSCS